MDWVVHRATPYVIKVEVQNNNTKAVNEDFSW